MAMTGGDILVETLIKWGVDTIFGIPGDGINGVFEALRQRQDKIRFVQVRHEESAAFAACVFQLATISRCARATVATQTFPAPACRSTRAHSRAVAPVV